jgi:hypothetical protein
MRILYQGNPDLAASAARLHIGEIVFTTNSPTLSEIEKNIADVPEELGKLCLVGQDQNGNQIYQVDFGKGADLALQILQAYLDANSGTREEWLIVDINQALGWQIQTGRFLMKLGMKGTGRRMVSRGVCRTLPRLKELVKS